MPTMTFSKNLVFICALFSFDVLAMDKGFRLPLDSISRDFSLMKLTPKAELIHTYILKTNYRIPKEEARDIAEAIVLVSECFQVDPWILTGLIQKESSFKKDAISPTGAAGLTQFTGIGFKEVNDQLGMRGRVGAPEAITLYFAGKIRSCVDPSWVDMWNRIEEKDDHPEFINLLKEEIKKDITSSIVYGAILLKTYLAFIHSKNSLEAVPLKMSEVYFQALQTYNGEEGDAKVRYAKNIFQNLQSLYPKEVNFPF